jgi:hypothetical protein
MLKTAARFLFLRVLPRRIVPIVTIIEAVLFVRGIRNRSKKTRINAPSDSRTAPPSRVADPSSPRTRPAATRT